MKDEENEGSTQPLLVHRAFSPAWSQIQRKPLLVLPETPRPSPKRPSTWSRFAQALVRLGRMGRKSHSHAQYAGPNPFVSPTSTPVYRASWAQHWQSLGQPWRTEPEIDIARQRQLMRCRQDGSLAGLSLTRADIEWLLSNHMQSHMPQHTRHASLSMGHALDVRGADMHEAQLTGLDLSGACLDDVNFRKADLSHTNLFDASLQGADLSEALLEGADLRKANLAGAILCGSSCNGLTLLDRVILDQSPRGCASFADVRWHTANLGLVDWRSIHILGDERQARKLKQHTRYRAAIRANRQLANTLRDQGLHEEADQFAYRAQRLKREVIAWQMLLLPSQKPEYRWMLRLLLRLHRKNAGRLTVLLLLLVLVINLVICAALLVVQALGQPIIIVALTAIALMLFFTFCFVLLTPTLQLFFLIVVQLTLLLLAQILLILGLLIVFQASLFPLIQPLINAPGLAQVLIVLILIFLLGACFGIAGYLYQRLSMLQRMVIYVLNTGGHLLRYVGLLLFLLGALVGKWVQYCFALFLDAVSGFGYKPERAVLSYIVVLLSFTSCFIWNSQLSLWEAFFLSLTSFHGRGFFQEALPIPARLSLHWQH